MNKPNQHDALVALLSQEDFVAQCVADAGGHDARLSLISRLLELAAEVSAEVADDIENVANGYDVDMTTGECGFDDGDECRGNAYHYHACSVLASNVSADMSKALERFNTDVLATDAHPESMTESDFVKAYSKL